MLAQRPFSNPGDFLDTADQRWAGLSPEDWPDAFRHHPPIGARKTQNEQSELARKWSTREQATAQKASAEMLKQFEEANEVYEMDFGHGFLICATGKTAAEIFESLHQRRLNDPQTELRNAAEEQCKITRIRLEKLLGL